MAETGDLTGVDMNNPTNIGFFSKVLLFKNDLNRHELLFIGQSNAEQRTLQAIAHSLSLEYEYTSATKTVKISRPEVLDVLFGHSLNGIVPSLIQSYDPELDALILNNTLIPDDYYDATPFNVDYGNLSSSMAPRGQIQTASFGSLTSSVPTAGQIEGSSFSQYNSIAERHDPSQQDPFSVPPIEFPAAPPTFNNTSVELQDLMTFPPDIVINRNNTCSSTYMDQISAWDEEMLKNLTEWEVIPQKCSICHTDSQSCSCQAAVSQRLEATTSSKAAAESTTGLHADTVYNHSITCSSSQPGTTPGSLPSFDHSSMALQLATRKRKNHERSPSPDVENRSDADEIKPYQCDLCPKRYFKAEQISRHRKADHADAAEKIFCSRCTLSFDGRILLARHLVSSSCKSTKHDWVDVGERVFDSMSTCSGDSNSSASSTGSTGPGRRGPLNRLARAGMRAVKKVGGVCWRCKFSKRSCDDYSPCISCHSDDKKRCWESIGCRRGLFQAPIINFCRRPRNLTRSELIAAKIQEFNLLLETASRMSSDEFRSWLTHQGHDRCRWDLYDKDPTFDRWSADTYVVSLEQRAFSILCNSLACVTTPQVLGEDELLSELIELLLSSVVYQARHQENHLIDKSLLCLRSCTEVLCAKAGGFLDRKWHGSCISADCKLKCVSSLTEHLNSYIQELSKVIFKKENLGKPERWELSVFYSFCLQSYVRRILIELTKNTASCNPYEDTIHDSSASRDPSPVKHRATFAKFHNTYQQLLVQPHDMYLTARFRAASSNLSRLPSPEINRNAEKLINMLSMYGNAEIPTKQLDPRFELVLKRSKLSLEAVATFQLNDIMALSKTEADQYLYLPLRLFLALNPSPLSTIDGLQESDNVDRAVARSKWDVKGIQSFKGHLQHVFQDDGRALREAVILSSADDLERWSSNESKISPCGVCRDFVSIGDPVGTLPCSHWFHEECIVVWSREFTTCPTCGVEIYDHYSPVLTSLPYSNDCSTPNTTDIYLPERHHSG